MEVSSRDPTDRQGSFELTPEKEAGYETSQENAEKVWVAIGSRAR